MHYFLRHPLRLPTALLTRLPYFGFVRGTRDHQNPISFEDWLRHRVTGPAANRGAYWPVHPSSRVVNPQNIAIGVDVCPGFMPGCYIQAIGSVDIGDFTQIAPSVGIISANHDPHDSRQHVLGRVQIGAYCWIGIGAKILPNVSLGDFTVVGAGAVVTKSFERGYAVLGGVPARVIRDIEPANCVRYRVAQRYHGYLTEHEYRVMIEYRRRDRA